MRRQDTIEKLAMLTQMRLEKEAGIREMGGKAMGWLSSKLMPTTGRIKIRPSSAPAPAAAVPPVAARTPAETAAFQAAGLPSRHPRVSMPGSSPRSAPGAPPPKDSGIPWAQSADAPPGVPLLPGVKAPPTVPGSPAAALPVAQHAPSLPVAQHAPLPVAQFAPDAAAAGGKMSKKQIAALTAGGATALGAGGTLGVSGANLLGYRPLGAVRDVLGGEDQVDLLDRKMQEYADTESGANQWFSSLSGEERTKRLNDLKQQIQGISSGVKERQQTGATLNPFSRYANLGQVEKATGNLFSRRADMARSLGLSNPFTNTNVAAAPTNRFSVPGGIFDRMAQQRILGLSSDEAGSSFKLPQ